MKYVIFDNKMPVIFSVDGNHADFEKQNLGKITSAGFALLENSQGILRIKTYGRSASLNIGPTPEDGDLLYNHLTTEDPGKKTR